MLSTESRFVLNKLPHHNKVLVTGILKNLTTEAKFQISFYFTKNTPLVKKFQKSHLKVPSLFLFSVLDGKFYKTGIRTYMVCIKRFLS